MSSHTHRELRCAVGRSGQVERRVGMLYLLRKCKWRSLQKLVCASCWCPHWGARGSGAWRAALVACWLAIAICLQRGVLRFAVLQCALPCACSKRPIGATLTNLYWCWRTSARCWPFLPISGVLVCYFSILQQTRRGNCRGVFLCVVAPALLADHTAYRCYSVCVASDAGWAPA